MSDKNKDEECLSIKGHVDEYIALNINLSIHEREIVTSKKMGLSKEELIKQIVESYLPVVTEWIVDSVDALYDEDESNEEY